MRPLFCDCTVFSAPHYVCKISERWVWLFWCLVRPNGPIDLNKQVYYFYLLKPGKNWQVQIQYDEAGNQEKSSSRQLFWTIYKNYIILQVQSING